jgi:hypothetical protein
MAVIRVRATHQCSITPYVDRMIKRTSPGINVWPAIWKKPSIESAEAPAAKSSAPAPGLPMAGRRAADRRNSRGYYNIRLTALDDITSIPGEDLFWEESSP